MKKLFRFKVFLLYKKEKYFSIPFFHFFTLYFIIYSFSKMSIPNRNAPLLYAKLIKKLFLR